MTDRVKALIVTLNEDMRVDDVQVLKDAIACFRHVLSVDDSVVTLDDLTNRVRIRRELREALYEAIDEKKKSY